jgi:superfamily II DNA or RNA helicase/HKD family nuclease
MSSSDLTFFTNEPNSTLLNRFKATLKDTHLFDVIVGYFRASGFYQLQDSISPIGKTRILIGLGLDDASYRIIDTFQNQAVLDFESHSATKRVFQDDLVQEIDESTEIDAQLEVGLRSFVDFLQAECDDPSADQERGGNGRKLEIRAFPSKNIHAKVYIGQFAPDDRDYGFVITGSSNFSYSGLVANREFNVELRQRRDVEFAQEQFKELWSQSVDVSQDFVDAVQQKTWLNDRIPPYELYLKLVYEYMQEDINLQESITSFLPEGFMDLQYQKQAVIQALKKLEEYNGVFLADVVGLGKTFIAAQLLQQIHGRILVICPPVLKSYWESSLHDFRVAAKVESLGKLDHIVKFGIDRFDYVVVDEAHRFRNENTQSYADLLDICRGKRVILLTATPINNTIDDVFSQLKLFQKPKNSTIPGIPNLEDYFKGLRSRFSDLDKSDPEYRQVLKGVSEEIRERILKHVMVRRTRTDVVTYFQADTESQGLVFPEIQDPQRITYRFEGPVEDVFNKSIDLLLDFRYARYTPLLYYVGQKPLTEFERQQQRNIGAFMKGVLIKRLESSFYAFRQTLSRFIESSQRFIEMLDSGTVYISKTVDVYELLDNDDLDTLKNLVEDERAQKYSKEDFSDGFRDDLLQDLDLLRQLKGMWDTVTDDPKLDHFLSLLKSHPILGSNKLVVFTESKETGDYLFDALNAQCPGEVLFFCSRGGQFGAEAQSHNNAISREMIRANFDPNEKEQEDTIRILLTTDILAEGINLHRSNALVNYDLPWNPTRVLQRAGRVNRLGSEHDEVHIFNFFPTTQADEHLGLETNILNKIQMFHHILGEDAKYLSDGEEFGSQELFDTLNRKSTYTGEDGEGDSELKYLDMMRKLRDESPDLFEKIKRLPKKARSGIRIEGLEQQQLLTFFRIGKLKKFYLNRDGAANELTFFEAASLAACDPDTPRSPIPENYFHLLETNKQRFDQDTLQQEEPESKTKGGRSNIKYVEMRLKDPAFKRCRKFTDLDEEFLAGVRNMIKQGTIAKKVEQTLKKEFEKTIDPLEMLASLRKHIRVVEDRDATKNKRVSKREIILSVYQKGGHE